MADLAITAANVLPSVYAQLSTEIAGAIITAGQALYKDPADSKVKLFKANVAAPVNVFYGISCCGAAPSQKIVVALRDNGTPGTPGTGFTIGATLAVGAVIIGSGTTAGNFAPYTDNASGWVCQPVGVCVAAATLLSVINFDPIANTIAT